MPFLVIPRTTRTTPGPSFAPYVLHMPAKILRGSTPCFANQLHETAIRRLPTNAETAFAHCASDEGHVSLAPTLLSRSL